MRLMQTVQEARPVRVVFFGDSLSEVGCSVVMSHFGIGGQNTYEGGVLMDSRFHNRIWCLSLWHHFLNPKETPYS